MSLASDFPSDILAWLRTFAPQTAAPAGQPDLVHQNLTELVMWLGEAEDYTRIEPRILKLRDVVEKHNTDCRDRCNRRRAEAVSCGGTDATKCATCPKQRGLSLVVQTLDPNP